MDARELSLSIIGRIADGRADPQQFTTNDFPAPYNQAIKIVKDHPEAIGNKDAVDILLTQALTWDDITEAHYQAGRLNGLGEDGVFDWRGSLVEATGKLSMIPELKRMLKMCEQNDPIDWTQLHNKTNQMIAGRRDGPQAANTIDYKSYVAYTPSGIPWMDKVIGGIPTDGPIVVVAPQGSGKSYFQFYSICSWLLVNPDKTACIYTLEMPAKHYLSRSLEMYPQFLPLVESGRLFISSSARSAEEIAAQTAIGKYGFIGVDDIVRVAKVANAERFEATYITLADISRLEGIPVQILAQPNREAKKSGKFIDIYDAAWSGAAENAAAMFMTLNKVFYADPTWQDERFVPVESENPHKTERLYVCFWKFRDNRPAELQQGLGAIRIEPDKNTGYYRQIWVGEALGNKLWPVSYKRPTAIGTPQAIQQEERPAIRLMKRD